MTTTKTTGQAPSMLAWGGSLQHGLNVAEKQLVKAAVNTVTELTKVATAQLEQITKSLAHSLEHSNSKSSDHVSTHDTVGCPSDPEEYARTHPAGSLKVDDKGVITTAGGYKIEATAQFNWKITGPDGKSTEIWGDPHVKESDGGEWQFKRDSTFMLPDGTRIDVTTKPYGNGATVSGQLDITSGNDRVSVTDIDKGKGKVGDVTHDGWDHVNTFDGDDVFAMGKESDDWTFENREIKGSENQGESFILGSENMDPGHVDVKDTSAPGSTGSTGSTNKPGNQFQQLANLFQSLSKVFDSLNKLSDLFNKRMESNPNPGIVPPGRQPAAQRRQGVLERSFSEIGKMLDTVTRFEKLARSIETNRNRFLA